LGRSVWWSVPIGRCALWQLLRPCHGGG